MLTLSSLFKNKQWTVYHISGMTNRTGFKFDQSNASIFKRVEKARNMVLLIILDLEVEQHGLVKNKGNLR